MTQPLIAQARVRHRRLRPRAHAFAYPSCFLLLPMRSLRATPQPAVNRNTRGWLSFHDADHGDGRTDSLAWLEELLHREGVADAGGEIWLHCLPRVLGYAFKPVSFWYCERADGALAAIVVEVNNTFGERHCYLLRGPELAWGTELTAAKVFHVSPFCRVEGHYRFRFTRSADGQRLVARIGHDDSTGLLLQTSVSSRFQPLTAASARAAVLAAPGMSLLLILRIHWQALRLALKRVPFFAKPPPPGRSVTQ